ncbi:exported hypothetical protein [Flavobacterium sp. 9AF]|uniref:hypothetical protein n=1 Tax=Flavobacterium sp. 9AF TaxID=2653142 RepID=UPI0012F0B831|nr:hypothetical protein [Flavobacterium sp. 9AF]VXB34255.1 exported hypothetical protein [Flavobacterium sp. 9AF]
MKKIILIIALVLSLISNAQQTFIDGVYNTNYGTINLTVELGIEYPNGGMIYGDYKGIGTITGISSNKAKEIVGSFHNGAAEGKFVFFCPFGKLHFFEGGISSFDGNWGYATDNKYSTNPDYIWKVTSKVAGSDAIKNVTNVWSGKWNTTQGYIILQQVGNKVTGKYHDVGNIDATYNPTTKKLTGTFTNNGNKGYLEYSFEGNSFKGKWGWTTALTGGNWDGTKHVKNNKVIANSSSSNTFNNLTASPASNLKKANDVTYECQLDYLINDPSKDIYGIGWIRFYIKNKNTNELQMIQPYMAKYLDKYGRIFEIPKAKSNDKYVIHLMNAPIRFKFNPNDYGYNSLEEMKGEAYFEFQFEVKEDGILSDEVVGKRSVKVFIENAYKIERKLYSDLSTAAIGKDEVKPGFFRIQGDHNVVDYGVYYSSKKL